MTKTKRNILVVAAAFLCIAMVALGGMIQNTRANLLQGNGAEVQVDLTSLDVKLMENGRQVNDEKGQGSLLTGLQGKAIDPGYTYENTVAVKNTGNSPEYVRVIITRYWTRDGNKNTSIRPETIQLLQNNEDWFVNQEETTTEQTVYYYRKALEAGETTSPLFSGMKLDSSIARDFTIRPQAGNAKVLKANFAYDGMKFNVEAEAQSIQFKYAEDAIPSAWGVNDIRVEDGGLSLAR